MKKVLVFGTFDIFHKGHENFLQQALEHGDYLVVVVARDETVEKVKSRRPLNGETFRKTEIEKNALVHEVVLGGKGDKYLVVETHKPDIICLGYDQIAFVDGLREELDKRGLERTEIVRLRPYKPGQYKSSKLVKKRI